MESATYNNLLFRTLADTVFWWLDRYEKFRKHLECRYPVVLRDNNPCVIFDLPERAAGLASTAQAPGHVRSDPP